jgi:hypothetical protein
MSRQERIGTNQAETLRASRETEPHTNQEFNLAMKTDCRSQLEAALEPLDGNTLVHQADFCRRKPKKAPAPGLSPVLLSVAGREAGFVSSPRFFDAKPPA